jgi:hypothetical protein
MATLAEVQNNLHFLNTGPSQIPGLIVMKLDDNGRDYGDYRHIVVVFDATLNPVSFQDGLVTNYRSRITNITPNGGDTLPFVIPSAAFYAQNWWMRPATAGQIASSISPRRFSSERFSSQGLSDAP